MGELGIMSNPRLGVWLTIPDECRMAGEFEVGDDTPDVRFTFGGERHDANLVFERAALTRFVELASRMLDLPPESDPSAVPSTMLVAHYGHNVRAANRYATCSPTPTIGMIIETTVSEPEAAASVAH